MSEVKTKVPQLRFPGFSDEWEEKKLGNISKLTSSKRVYLDDYVQSGIPFYRGKEISELQKGLTPKDILYISNESYEQYKSKYGIPQVDDILITAVGTLGNILRIKDRKPFYFKDGNLIWIKDIYEYSNFLEILLEVKNKEIQKTSIGSTQRALTMVELRKLLLPFPAKQEQQKIAAFLTAVDTKIEQLSTKQVLLGEYKKGLMQQIFSQAIRFKADDGCDFPDWKEKKLGSLCEITTGKLDANAMVKDGQYRFYTCAKEYYKIDDYAFDTDALIVSGNGANVGYIHHYQGKFNAYQRTYVLDSFTDNIVFVKFVLDGYLHKRIMKEKNEGNTPYIVMGTLTDMKINLPSFSEQTKISNFLSSIDSKIEQVSKQLDESKQFKKALLQQMFV